MLLVELKNQPGALAHVCEMLAADHINIDYCYASSGGRNGKVMGVFKVSNTDRAGKALNSSPNRRRERTAAPRTAASTRRPAGNRGLACDPQADARCPADDILVLIARHPRSPAGSRLNDRIHNAMHKLAPPFDDPAPLFRHGGAAESPDLLDFSVNVNPLGPPEGILRLSISVPRWPDYPDPHCRRLTEALANQHQVDPSRSSSATAPAS